MSDVVAETPLGNALARMVNGERCAVATVLICPECGRAYPDHEDVDPGFCGPCDHVARHMEFRRVRLCRRARRPGDDLRVSFRW